MLQIIRGNFTRRNWGREVGGGWREVGMGGKKGEMRGGSGEWRRGGKSIN